MSKYIRVTVDRRFGTGNMINKKFGRLTVIKWVGWNKHGYLMFKCFCACGNFTVSVAGNLKQGKKCNSCGCVNARNTKHGMEGTPEYKAYMQAKTRCNNTNSPDYDNYGGRGIGFLFKSFQEWYAHIGPKPEPKRLYSQDRKDNDGNYEIGNIKWSTKSEQNSNQRRQKKAA